MERAKIGDIEISVISTERLNNKALVTERPVEKGQDVVDHTKKLPHTIELTGVVVGDDAGDKLQKLKKLQEEGTLIKYIHRNALDNMVIEDISSVHEAKIRNGFSFNIRLKHVRIATAKEIEIKINVPAKAESQVKPTTNKGLQTPREKPVSPVVRTGTTDEVVAQSLTDISQVNSLQAIKDLALMKPYNRSRDPNRNYTR